MNPVSEKPGTIQIKIANSIGDATGVPVKELV